MTDRQKIHSLAPSTKPSAFEVEKTIEKSKRYKSEGTGSNSSRIYSCRRWNTHTHTHTYIYIYIYIYILFLLKMRQNCLNRGRSPWLYVSLRRMVKIDCSN